MKEKFIFKGESYWIDTEKDIYPSNRVFPGWWGDAKEGETYYAEYIGIATKENKFYDIYWQFLIIKGCEPEDESDYPWDNEHISNVEII